jgi:hypothetical protein
MNGKEVSPPELDQHPQGLYCTPEIVEFVLAIRALEIEATGLRPE